MELTVEGTGCLTWWAQGKGSPGWVPWGAGQGRVARGEREMTQSINQIKTVTSPPKNSISPIF